MPRRFKFSRFFPRAIVTSLLAVFISIVLAGMAHAFPIGGTYKNLAIQNGPDPSIIAVCGTDGLTHWYMYCTSGPINDNDKSTSGVYTTHLMSIYHSTDLVTWNYVGDVFPKRPKWVGSSNLWAPDIQFFNGKYYLYYTAANAGSRGNKGSGGAIGVATSTSPTGPWTDSGGAVVEVQTNRWVYDPFVVVDDYGPAPTGQRYLFYGSFGGGIFARKLSADGLHTDKSSEVAIAVSDLCWLNTLLARSITMGIMFASISPDPALPMSYIRWLTSLLGTV